jgi:Ca2+-binding RTX toxin-like protein
MGKPIKSHSAANASGSDTIKGSAGSDYIDGGAGNDILTGAGGADTFVFHIGSGNDVVTDFHQAEGDHLLFDFGSYSQSMVSGALYDGETWWNASHTAQFTVSAQDTNGDGHFDSTSISIATSGSTDSVMLLGLVPLDLSGSSLIGG